MAGWKILVMLLSIIAILLLIIFIILRILKCRKAQQWGKNHKKSARCSHAEPDI